MSPPGSGSWERQLLHGVVVVLVVAVVGHLAWQLLSPLLPTLIVLLVVGGLLLALLRRH